MHDDKFLADYSRILAGDSVSPTNGADLEELYKFTLGDLSTLVPQLQHFMPECKINTDFG